MSTLAVDVKPFAQSVSFTEDDLTVVLADGRTIIVPLIWFHRLAEANLEQLENYELLGDGEGIHWPDLDEDISVDGLLRGAH